MLMIFILLILLFMPTNLNTLIISFHMFKTLFLLPLFDIHKSVQEKKIKRRLIDNYGK